MLARHLGRARHFQARHFGIEHASPAAPVRVRQSGGYVFRRQQGRRKRLYPEQPKIDLPPMLPRVAPDGFPAPAWRSGMRARRVRELEAIILLNV